MSDKPRILCVDDEVNILKAIQRSLRKEFEIVTASSGQEGLDILASSEPFEVVISDMKMPNMNGATFLRHVRQQHPDAVRLLLTGFADLDTVVTAVNEGYIYRFIAKPCSAAVLLEAINDAVKQHHLLTAEKVLLEQTLKGSIHALTEVLAMANPAAFGRGTRVCQTATRIAKGLDVPEMWQVEVAAMLSQIGCITLPHATATKLHKGDNLTPQEQAMVDRMPAATCRILETIPRMEGVLEILTHQGLNFDGADTPEDGPVGDDIPLGARILKVAGRCEDLQTRGLTPGKIFDDLMAFHTIYDPEVVKAYETIVVKDGARETTRGVTTLELRTGMVFVEDVKAKSGLLLVASGQECTVNILERVKNYEHTVGVETPMWVMNTEDDEATEEGDPAPQ